MKTIIILTLILAILPISKLHAGYNKKISKIFVIDIEIIRKINNEVMLINDRVQEITKEEVKKIDDDGNNRFVAKSKEVQKCNRFFQCKIKTLEKLCIHFEKYIREKEFLDNETTLILKSAESFSNSIRNYVMMLKILVLKNERREDLGSEYYFRFSNLRGYSIAYTGYIQSLDLLLLHVQEQQNYCETTGLLNDIHQNTQSLLADHRKINIGLSLIVYSGKKTDNSFKFVGFNLRFPIKKRIYIVPELSIDYDGENQLVFGGTSVFEFSKKINLFVGGDLKFPKYDDVKLGAHFGLNFHSIRPLVFGIRYSTLFGIGVNLTILL